MLRGVWVCDPDRGGTPIPPTVRERTDERIRSYAERHFRGNYTRLGIRFQKQFCYIDAFTEPDVPKRWPPPEVPDLHETREERVEQLRETPIHLCRLRYFRDDDRWSFAMFGYSNEKYALTILPSGEFFGTPEEAFAAAAGAYLS